MFGKFNWNKVKVNRWSVVIFTLLMIAGIQGCDMGPCLNSVFAAVIVFVVVSLVILMLVGWIPFIGQILAIILMGYLFKFACLNNRDHGPKESCGCSAFCNTIQPEKADFEFKDLKILHDGKDD